MLINNVVCKVIIYRVDI